MVDKNTINNVIWSDKRTKLGITIELKVERINGAFILSGSGEGHGAGPFTFSRGVSGNLDWSGVIGRHNGTDVHLHVRITNWKYERSYLSFDLNLWGAYGHGPWLPVGGEHFRVEGSALSFDSADALAAFLRDELQEILQERGSTLLADPPQAAAS